MTSSQPAADHPGTPETPPHRTRRRLKAGVVLLAVGLGSAGAFHFLKGGADTSPAGHKAKPTKNQTAAADPSSPKTETDRSSKKTETESPGAAKPTDQEETYRQALLGRWTHPDYYGQTTLELREDGTGSMWVQFEGKYRFLVGDHLDVDIEWEVIDNHVIFDSVRGRPATAFKFITGLKGTRRDYVIMHLDESTFKEHDAGDESKVKTWKRLAEK